MPTSSHSDARERILAAATRLFYTKGYRATGINEVIAEAGVAKATLYHHYPSKDDLGADWLRHKMETKQAYLQAIARSHEPLAARVTALFDLLERGIADPEYRGCPFANISTEVPEADHPLHAIACEHKHNVRAIIRELVQPPRPGDPAMDDEERRYYADALYLLFFGAASIDICGDRENSVRVARESALRILKTLGA